MNVSQTWNSKTAKIFANDFYIFLFEYVEVIFLSKYFQEICIFAYLDL